MNLFFLFLALVVAGVMETRASEVSMGTEHACVIANGGVECWPHTFLDYFNSQDPISVAPVQVVPQGSDAVAISTFNYNTCAVVKGGVTCWENHINLQVLGHLNFVPVQVIPPDSGATQVSVNSRNSCAIVNNGVKCWTRGAVSFRHNAIPIDIIAPNSGVTALSSNSDHTCAVVKGGVKCWGSNKVGQLGDGSLTDRDTPVDAIAPNSDVTDISVGLTFVCAVMKGGVKCWGGNGVGQLGDGTLIDRKTPVNVIAPNSGVSSIATSRNFGFYSDSHGDQHTCVIVNGGVRCWGSNSEGQLGDGSQSNRSTPVEVITSGSSVTAISMGFAHTCAVIQGGLKCWGDNRVGQLGDGTTINRSTPVDIVAINSGVGTVTAGGWYGCFVKKGSVRGTFDEIKCRGAYFVDGGKPPTWASLSPVQVEVKGFEAGERARAAAARASSDPQLASDQAALDAQEALNKYVAAAQRALDAQSASSKDPLNATLASTRDAASKDALEAQLASNRAASDAQLKREAVTKAHYENIIADMKEGHEKEVKAYKSVIKVLCFPGETLIGVKGASSNGHRSIPISSIKVGDSVVSCNMKSSRTCEFKKVQEVFVNTTNHLIKLTAGGKRVRATDNHPFYVVNKRAWVEAQDLHVGDQLQSISGETVMLEDIEDETGRFDVYNLDVEGNHNYYACDILVHNCDQLGIQVPKGF